MIAGLPDATARWKAGASLGRADRLAVAAAGAGERGEIGIDQIGRDDPARIIPLLMHPDSAMDAIVDDHQQDRAGVLDGRGELLAGDWKHPSPANATTLRSGYFSLAAIAAGRP